MVHLRIHRPKCDLKRQRLNLNRLIPLLQVQYRRLDLLKHPLIGSLLHHKWKVFGFCYFLNLLWYILFLAFLTVFALLIPSPVEPTCKSITNQKTKLRYGVYSYCDLNHSFHTCLPNPAT